MEVEAPVKEAVPEEKSEVPIYRETAKMCIRDSYDVNPEYLADEKFATLITEAEKYLGYPYVWGLSLIHI